MRPHNSGHWTIEGSVTSQFEQHLRAVLDYPLGATTTTAPVTVMANVLGGDPTPAMRIDERLHHPTRASPTRACTSTARPSVPAARSAT